MDLNTILVGDVRERIKDIPDESIQCVITSPPYFGLRDYNTEGQIGLEPTVDAYVAELVAVFREVRRVLRKDGTVWLVIGDSYNTRVTNGFRPGSGRADGIVDHRGQRNRNGTGEPTLKPKDLIGAPWRVAFALQADGWYLRRDNIWHKPNPMPESATDRCTTAHEYVFHFTKSARYYYDHVAIAEPSMEPERKRKDRIGGALGHTVRHSLGGIMEGVKTRNKRSVWTIATQPMKEAHFATFPEKLVEPCILAGSRPGDTVLDPFIGSGTVAVVAERHGRNWLGIDLTYQDIAWRRIEKARTAKPRKQRKKKDKPITPLEIQLSFMGDD